SHSDSSPDTLDELIDIGLNQSDSVEITGYRMTNISPHSSSSHASTPKVDWEEYDQALLEGGLVEISKSPRVDSPRLDLFPRGIPFRLLDFPMYTTSPEILAEKEAGVEEGRKSFLKSPMGSIFVETYRKEVVKAFCKSPDFLDELVPTAIEYFDFAFSVWESAVANIELAGKVDKAALKETLPNPVGYADDDSLHDDRPWWSGIEARAIFEAGLSSQLVVPPTPLFGPINLVQQSGADHVGIEREVEQGTEPLVDEHNEEQGGADAEKPPQSSTTVMMLLTSRMLSLEFICSVLGLCPLCSFCFACLAVPADNAPDQEKEEYARWKKADEMAKCYILASLSNVLQHQQQSMNTIADMLLNLKELFGHQSRAARQEAMRILMNMTMREGTPVREHVLAMMAQLKELEVLGAFIDGETQVDIVLQSLPKCFEQFRLNYNMNKMLMTLPELVAELQAAEGLFRQKTQAMVAQRGEASTSKAPKGKKRKKKPKGKCYNCQQKGHWKANCPLSKKPKKGTPFALVVETCLAVLSTSTWCVDTRATDHVCNSLQGFQETKRLREGEVTIYLGDASRADVYLDFGLDRFLVLKDCLYVPSFRKNLISVSKLFMNGFSATFDNKVVIRFGKKFICSGSLVDNLYILES
ncbi:Unknown protein, partial [Striga hermonthica]